MHNCQSCSVKRKPSVGLISVEGTSNLPVRSLLTTGLPEEDAYKVIELQAA